MRMMLRVTVPVEKGNAGIKSGALKKLMQTFMAVHKPEAAYFTADRGYRTAFFFLVMKDASQIPAVAEPFFMEMDATVEFIPAMNAEDLARGLANIQA
jgi:hypothetical protein